MNEHNVMLEPWAEGGKLPWDDPVFSARMLHEHLSQSHDGASRRLNTINLHVIWLHSVIMKKKPGRILDIGCGPGFYTERLAKLGHACTGIDFSPAAITYARQIAEEQGLNCTYLQADATATDYGNSYDLVCFLYGELNAFKPDAMCNVLQRAWKALKPGGHLILEMFEIKFLQQLGSRTRSTETVSYGLFSDKPYQRVTDSFYCNTTNATVECNTITDKQTGAVTTYVNTLKAYSDKEYLQMLMDAGFIDIKRLPALGGKLCAAEYDGLFVLYAAKPVQAGDTVQ